MASHLEESIGSPETVEAGAVPGPLSEGGHRGRFVRSNATGRQRNSERPGKQAQGNRTPAFKTRIQGRCDPSTARATLWDAIIIGTGMGGSAVGFALAQAGWRILFLEKGRANPPLRGQFAEAMIPLKNMATGPFTHRERLSQAGRASTELLDVSGRSPHAFTPFIGCGAGGSTAVYGAALERLFPCDFFPRSNFSNSELGTSNLPEAWPIEYEELKPFYQQAEAYFEVHGSMDPLRQDAESYRFQQPPPLTATNQTLFKSLKSENYHPYQLPLATRPQSACPGCQGYLCAHDCKRDAANVFLEPAIHTHGAQWLDGCTVAQLEASKTHINEVRCIREGRPLTVRGRIVVLAAGALATPGILLNSNSRHWPRGLANRSGLVGRNLMRHFVDLYLISTGHSRIEHTNQKQIALNDFYRVAGQKLGSIQSFGVLPAPETILMELEQELRVLPSLTKPLLNLIRPLLRTILQRKRDASVVLASIQEDLPYPEHSVRLAPNANADGIPRLQFEYRIKPNERDRIQAFRTRIDGLPFPNRPKRLAQADNNTRIAHACGTCRFGADPRSSVLNKENRAHGISNLYITDASFFPSSGGTNPGLTIAANALRVAQALLGRSPALSGPATKKQTLEEQAQVRS